MLPAITATERVVVFRANENKYALEKIGAGVPYPTLLKNRKNVEKESSALFIMRLSNFHPAQRGPLGITPHTDNRIK